MPAEEAHRDAFWVITVVGGMSVTKALEDALSALTLSHWSLENGVIVLRLFIFLLTAIRLFIGASVFFQEVHIERGHATVYPSRNYVVDFASAIVHFSFLFLLALSIKSVPPIVSLSQEHFFLALCAILLYDWIWLLVSTDYTTYKTIKKWAISNSVTVLPCGLAFTAFFFGGVDRAWFEILLAASVFLFGLPDLIRMSRGSLPS